MKTYFEKLREYIEENPPNFGDGESILTLLYEAYADSNRMDDGMIREDFNELYGCRLRPAPFLRQGAKETRGKRGRYI